MKDQFQRLLDLAKITGDRLIVTDTDGNNAFVVMDIDQYESLIYEGHPEMMEEWDVNEIPEFEPEMQNPEQTEVDLGPTIWETMHPASEKHQETWDLDGLDEEEMGELERKFKEFVAENGSSLDEKQEGIINEVAEEEKVDVSEEEQDEEQFYLEPIE